MLVSCSNDEINSEDNMRTQIGEKGDKTYIFKNGGIGFKAIGFTGY